MERPSGVNQAVVAIWAIIFLSAVMALIAKLAGNISMGEFAFTIILYGLFCILPYKISQGSNATRYVYIVLVVISILFMFAGVGSEIPQNELILSVLLIPVEVFIVYRLFQPEASAWFSKS